MAIASMLFSLVVVNAMEANGLATVLWRVRVATGKQESSGTIDRVYIRLEQGTKKTSFYRLNNRRNNFQRGTTDEFNLPINSIEEPDKITVYNRGTDMWFVSWIVLRRLYRRDKLRFDIPIHRWLANGDPWIVGLLGPRQKLYCDWRVLTYTGKKRYSETDDDVFISVKGDHEWTALYEMESPKDNFEWSAKDEFSFRSKCFKPTMIKVLLRGNDGWFLSRIELYRKDDTKEVYIFLFQIMLDNNERNYINVLNPLGEPLCEWQVNVLTGDQQYADSQSIVYIQLFGSRRETGVFELPYWFHRYKKGAEDLFFVKTYCVIPTKIAVSLEGNDNWFLDWIELQMRHNRDEKYIFPFYKWFDEGTTHNIEVLDSADKPYCDWSVTTWTSSRLNGDTNDAVHIKIYGNGTWTSSYRLNSPKNDFERGEDDTFDFQSNCLIPTKINVQLRGDDAWRLVSVRLIRRDYIDKEYIFVCNCWLDNNGQRNVTVES